MILINARRHAMRSHVFIFILAVLIPFGSVFSADVSAKKPDNYPNSPYPAPPLKHAGKQGHRFEMGELLKHYKVQDLILKCNVDQGGSYLGKYSVGDQLNFGIAIGPKDSKYYGSVKHGRDGGDLFITAYWMDPKSKKVVSERTTVIKSGC
jgi:hypothetical protein